MIVGFMASLILALVLFYALFRIDKKLKTVVVKKGIVSFELAGSREKANAMLDSWTAQQKIYAALSLGLDYLFIFTYACALAMAVILLTAKLDCDAYVIFMLGNSLLGGVTIAAVLDMLEDYALIRELLGSQNPRWPLIARYCALIKFTLIGLVIVSLVIGCLWLLIKTDVC